MRKARELNWIVAKCCLVLSRFPWIMIFTIFWRVENGNPEEILPWRWQEISKSLGLLIPYLCSASWLNSSSWITCDSHFLPLKSQRFICFPPSFKPWPKLNSSWDEQSECQPRMNGTLALLMIRVYRFSTKMVSLRNTNQQKKWSTRVDIHLGSNDVAADLLPAFNYAQSAWPIWPQRFRRWCHRQAPATDCCLGVFAIQKPPRFRGKPLTEPRNLNCWNLTPCRHLVHQKEPWVLGTDAGPEFLFSQVHEPRPKPNCRRKHMETWNKVGH